MRRLVGRVFFGDTNYYTEQLTTEKAELNSDAAYSPAGQKNAAKA
jgi:hypothetical protein